MNHSTVDDSALGIYTLEGRRLSTASDDFYIAPGARLIGSVRLGVCASVWFNSVLRGDDERIEIGDGSNVQDCVVIHADPGTPTLVGRDVTIGHRVLLHGCRIEDESLIGNGAIVLDGAHVGRHCIVGAGALVPPHREIPDGSVVMGMPARAVRAVTEADLSLIARAAANYRERVRRYRAGLQPLPPPR
jgi:carbonic anhydrase/acetyltransferase-like protein (isoleucine patch superfamily)